jgi:hypothetical protein
MSGLEDHVKPILLPLITEPDKQRTLNFEDRLAIASWFTLKAIVIDHNRVQSQGATPFFSPQQRAAFQHSLVPPDRVSVWIARLNHSPQRGGLLTPLYCTFHSGVNRHLMAYCLTFSTFRIAFQLLAHKPYRRPRPGALNKLPILIYPTRGTWDDYVLRVWSDQGDITWPPSWQLSAAEFGSGDFQFLAYRFFGLSSSGGTSPLQP